MRDRVASRIPLGFDGKVVVATGTVGEVVKVFRYAPDGPVYPVYVPETALEPVEDPA